MKPGSLATIGLPCSSFVFLNSGTSKRTPAAPLGREELGYIRRANSIAARVCLLILLLTARKCYWLVEQPSSSMFEEIPYFQHVMMIIRKFMKVHRTFFWMGCWGHFSSKGSLAYGTLGFIPKLAKRLTKKRKIRYGLSSEGVVKKGIDKRGRKVVSGGNLLRLTQEYPRKFCARVVKLHLMYL
ncbi:RHM1, partial [Symbiodinium pilosum]